MKEPNKRRELLKLLGATGILCVMPSFAEAVNQNTEGSRNRSDFVIEVGRLDAPLIAEHADKRIMPASLTKMMTAYVALKLIKNGHMKLDERIRISTRAQKELRDRTTDAGGKRITVQRALELMLTGSYNDIAYSMAQHMSQKQYYVDLLNINRGAQGTEWAFVTLIVPYEAHAIGMSDQTRMFNSHGLPGRLVKILERDEGRKEVLKDSAEYHNRTTARDMAILTQALINDFPEFMDYFRQPEVTALDGISTVYNTNSMLENSTRPLLEAEKTAGVIGLKTGYYREAGSCIALRIKRHGHDLVVITTGHLSPSVRNDHARYLINEGIELARERKLLERSFGDVDGPHYDVG